MVAKYKTAFLNKHGKQNQKCLDVGAKLSRFSCKAGLQPRARFILTFTHLYASSVLVALMLVLWPGCNFAILL